MNPRPLRCERSALPTELAPHSTFIHSVRRTPTVQALYTTISCVSSRLLKKFANPPCSFGPSGLSRLSGLIVCLVCLIGRDSPDEPDRPDQPNRPDRPSLLLRRADDRFTFMLSRLDQHVPPFNPQTPLGKQLDCSRIDFMFLCKNPSGQCIGRVVIENRHRRLKNNWPFIHAFRDKVDRASSKFAAPLNRFLLHI